MLFALIADDRPASAELRAQTRPAHLAYLEELGAAVRFAGPFLDAKGQPNGSLVVVESEDEAAARTLFDADPYVLAGLFETTTVRPWRWVVNAPES